MVSTLLLNRQQKKPRPRLWPVEGCQNDLCSMLTFKHTVEALSFDFIAVFNPSLNRTSKADFSASRRNLEELKSLADLSGVLRIAIRANDIVYRVFCESRVRDSTFQRFRSVRRSPLYVSQYSQLRTDLSST